MPDRVTTPGPRPVVLVYRHPAAPAPVLRQVCAGVEEEGVPTDVVDVPGPDDGEPLSPVAPGAVALAHAAAGASPLGVGVGLDASGAVTVHHGTLPERTPVSATPAGAGPPEWRRAGRIAARVVKHLPLE